MERLRQRAEFLATASGVKVATAAFVLQARERGDNGPVRVGFTVSRKVGTAVERNRVRRRLKNLVSQSAPLQKRLGHDYVLVGRRAALHRPFNLMVEDFAGALRRLDQPRPKRNGTAEGRRHGGTMTETSE